MSARIISVANIKGGVSKTSTSLFLATSLSINGGHKVLFLDCDSQASASEYRQFEKLRIYKDTPEPYPIRKTDPTFIFDTLQDAREKYDAIFIDLPRLTRAEDDKKIAMILTLCDSVLIPVRSGELDNLSTQAFLKIVQQIDTFKKEKNHPYQYACFSSMTGRRPTEDMATKDFIKNLGVHMLESDFKDVKEFSSPYTYESLLDIGKAERERFKSFYDEFTQFFNL